MCSNGLSFFGLSRPDAHLLGTVMRSPEYYSGQQEDRGSHRYTGTKTRLPYIAARFHPDPEETPRRPLVRHGGYARGLRSLRLVSGTSVSISSVC